MAYEQSIVVCWEGPRGSGKTLSMVYDAIIRMLRGIQVWSNINIEFSSSIVTPGKLTHYCSTPIDMDAIYSFDQGVANGFVYIDELPLWVNSRRSMTVANSLVNSMFSIIRHRGLSFGITSQQYDWLDKRIKYQVDILVSCFDLHFKFWHLPPGALIGLAIKDLSGLTTGHPYHQTGRVRQRQLYAKPFWNCYDSWQEFDVLEAAQSVKRGERKSKEGISNDKGILAHLSAELRNNGQGKMSTSVFYDMARVRGYDSTVKEGNIIMAKELGIIRVSDRYFDFSLEPI